MSGVDKSKSLKAEAFQRLAVRRTNEILDKLRLLGNLSNRGAYEYNSEDVDKIFRAISSEVKKARAKFEGGKESKFEL